jgi:beta-xylosidase
MQFPCGGASAAWRACRPARARLNQRRRAAWLVLCAALAACASAADSTATAALPAGTATPTATRAATRTPRPSQTPVPTAAEGSYVNPVLDRDFPDPDVLLVEGQYYAYATNSGEANIQVARSHDLVAWEVLGDALPELPAWAVQDFGWAWAPEVTLAADGETYLMYFTARFALGAGGTQCIGVATSVQPVGPFVAAGSEPLICPVGQGGAIDAASFVDDDNSRYLLWKNDGNSGGGRTFIYLQPISADGLVLTGEAHALISADQAWEGILVEGPTLWKDQGRYTLLYSANNYASPQYAVGVATADSIAGPYEKASEPLLATDLEAGIVGPGGQDIVLGPHGDTWLLFHGWTPKGYRALNLGQLEWHDGEPELGPLTRGPMPGPALTTP